MRNRVPSSGAAIWKVDRSESVDSVPIRLFDGTASSKMRFDPGVISIVTITPEAIVVKSLTD